MDLSFHISDWTHLPSPFSDHTDPTQAKTPFRCKISISAGHQRFTDLDFRLTVYFIAI